MSFVFSHSVIFRPVLMPPTENRHELSEQPNIFSFSHRENLLSGIIKCSKFSIKNVNFLSEKLQVATCLLRTNFCCGFFKGFILHKLKMNQKFQYSEIRYANLG